MPVVSRFIQASVLFCDSSPRPTIVSVTCDFGVKLFWNLFSVLRLQKAGEDVGRKGAVGLNDQGIRPRSSRRSGLMLHILSLEHSTCHKKSNRRKSMVYLQR